MSEFQVVSVTKLRKLLEQRNLWSRMRAGRLRVIEKARAPAKVSPGGTSYIILYYDDRQNMFTIHRIVTKEGKVIHEHVKDAFVDGVRYKAKQIQGR